MATNENLPPKVIKQLAKELKSLDESPPEDIRVHVNDDNFSTILADIEGPPSTPYAGGVFRIRLLLSQDFPQSPPKGYFLTKIFHPNIAKNGEICVNTLKKDWKPTLGLRHVLLAIRCLLIEPFPESALNEEAGKMLMEDYDSYAKHARLLTGIHAIKPKPKSTMAVAESATMNSTNAEANIVNNTTPATYNTANKSTNADPVIPLSSSEAATACPSPSAKKPKGDLLPSGISSDKRKVDVRKKSLKRL